MLGHGGPPGREKGPKAGTEGRDTPGSGGAAWLPSWAPCLRPTARERLLGQTPPAPASSGGRARVRPNGAQGRRQGAPDTSARPPREVPLCAPGLRPPHQKRALGPHRLSSAFYTQMRYHRLQEAFLGFRLDQASPPGSQKPLGSVHAIKHRSLLRGGAGGPGSPAAPEWPPWLWHSAE